MKGYSETDFEGGPLRFGVGGGAVVHFDRDDNPEPGIRSNIDYALKLYGFSSTGGLYLSSEQTGGSVFDQSYAALGYHLQAGYLVADLIQPVVRFAYVAPEGPDNNLQEFLAGISLYFFNHGFKWQTDAGPLTTSRAGGSTTNFQIRSQVQLAF
jgi:hypothetical protein